MQLDCPRCAHVLEFSGSPPRFCSNCGQPLASAPPEPTTPAGAYDAQATVPLRGAPPSAAGRDSESVGAYRLLRTLGGGGMGTVYEAEQVGSGRHVALKLIRPEFAESPDAVERFRREGRLASTITHPRCVFVLAADEQAGRPYIVMELMPGRNLHDLVSEGGPLPVREAVEKILDVIEGLQEAHRRGVIHRDVKPSNCFLDADGRVKVGDFGLAKSLIGPEVLTRSGAFLGTLLYASPEQIRNEAVSGQTDVYSVCATLYFLLTGRAPFQAADNDPAATLARTVSDPLVSMRRYRPELPHALDEIVRRGLARQPSRRWPGLEELRLALLPFVESPASIDHVGWRVGAYVCDLVLLAPIELIVQRLLGGVGLDGSALGYSGRLLAALLLSLLCGLGYFAVAEWLWGCTPGKYFTRLRVRESVGHDRPRLWCACLRLVWFFVFRDLTVGLVGLLLMPVLARRVLQGVVVDGDVPMLLLGAAVVVLPFAVSGVGTALLAATMRKSNGYRMLHEWLSGTETIRLPAPRSALAVPDRSRAEAGRLPEIVPAKLGAFAVRAVLRQDKDDWMLACEDEALRRPVWVWMRRGDAVAGARRDLSRPTRPRWLGGGERDGWHWDAFVAAPGCLLADLVNRRQRLSWLEALLLLGSLADELDAAAHDGTLPATLALSQVWVQPSGQALLLEAPLRQDTPSASALDLLRRVAALALEGQQRAPHELSEPIRAPLPQHAGELLERLTREEFADLAELQAALAEARGRAAEISRPRRALQLALGGLARAPGLAWLFGLGMAFLLASYFYVVAGRAGCEMLLESPEAPRQRREYERIADRLEREQTLLLDSCTRYFRAQLLAGEPTLRSHYSRLLKLNEEDDPEPTPDSMSQMGDDLLEGPSLLAQEIAKDVWRVLLAFAAWPCLWAVWSAVTRGGLTMRLAGITLLDRDGRPAARWRCGWRSLAAWLPVVALLLLSFWLDVWRVAHGPDESNVWLDVAAWLAWWAWWQALLLLPLYLWMSVRWPHRGLHDRLAGTYPVPV